MISFACISPHPPIILPSIGSKEELILVKETISSLRRLNKELLQVNPDRIIISAPHPDWGFDVPLNFLAKNLRTPIESILIKNDPPIDYFEAGKRFYQEKLVQREESIALIASGDLSHRLKADGPYGLHLDGEKFDKMLIKGLINRDTATILKLDDLYPEAGECGLRSFCFMLGILEESGVNWKADILSYEAPFGVGYLVANLKF